MSLDRLQLTVIGSLATMSVMITKPRSVPVIALITDFGLQDSYVGVMKGVILSICPYAQIIDLTHAIQPQNVQQAAYVLLSTLDYLPQETIVVAVIDPGVGSSRKPVAIKTNRGVLVGPDNGVFSYMLKYLDIEQIVTLQTAKYQMKQVSMTFHGRDIFSPAAAHVAMGIPLEEMGPVQADLVWLPPPPLDFVDNAIHGEIIHIDHFGNMTTSIGRLEWSADDFLELVPFFDPSADKVYIRPESCSVSVAGVKVEPLVLTFTSVQPGELLALINSAGHLEIAINRGNAAQHLGAAIGDPIVLHAKGR